MKLRNKLILSCAALAAVATTAVSTTYAWYTANESVKATGITGKTSQTDATLLLISKTAQVGKWGASVAVDSSAVTLDPLAYDSTANKYYPWVSTTNKVDTAEASGGLTASDKYISFYLYFKSGSSQSLDVQIKSFTLVNTKAATLPTFSVLAAGTGATGNTYTVDMMRALNVVITVDSGKEVGASADSPTVSASATRTAYNCDSLAGTIGDTETQKDTIGTAANAHTYYNNVKSLTGTDAISTSKESSETSVTDIATLNTGNFKFALPTGAGAQAATATTPSDALDNILMVKFDIYLDGWDKYCFDAVRKQDFTLNMEFTGIPHTDSTPAVDPQNP